jgi:two-component system, NtrC family, sensor histidine kinase HydH
MTPAAFEQLKRYLEFGKADAENIRSLAGEARALIPNVVEQFYGHILADPEALRIFTGGEEQIDRQRRVMRGWLEDVFAGDYGPEYVKKRTEIGHAHVRVGLPQHYMFTSMEVVWRGFFVGLIGDSTSATRRRELSSLHALLMLDLAIMLASYQDSYTEQVRKRERSAVEEKLTRAEHLAEIGQLAASLAHEIKNPLAGISGAIQIIQDAMRDDDPHRPIISEVIGQIHRLDATVKDLLLYARPIPPKATSFPLANVAARVLSVLREEPAMLRIRTEFDPGPVGATIHADEAQVEHLLMNLILNAAQASPAGEIVRVRIQENGSGSLRFVVQDNGVGMPPEVRDRAFEAFFTTKAKGTGLGLSICRKIVDAHNGTISLDSERGGGTTVMVDLPRNKSNNSFE